jgi:hypothetical protein
MGDFEIDLPHPRQENHPRFLSYLAEIRQVLQCATRLPE